MILNQAGMVVERVWKELPLIFSGLALDCFVVMPNHVHGILIVQGGLGYYMSKTPATISQVIGAFKSKTNVCVHREVLPNRTVVQLWQKSFYDHVIRTGADLDRTREYIVNNIQKWELDEYFTQT